MTAKTSWTIEAIQPIARQNTQTSNTGELG